MSNKGKTPDHAGRFAYDGLDRVIHEKRGSGSSPRWRPIPTASSSTT